MTSLSGAIKSDFSQKMWYNIGVTEKDSSEEGAATPAPRAQMLGSSTHQTSSVLHHHYTPTLAEMQGFYWCCAQIPNVV
jgi:hypothetical protein